MKKSLLKTLGATGIALMTLSGAAAAEDKFEWSTTLTGTTDYVFRGISTRNEDPAFQASIDATYGIFYLSLWGSQLPDDIFGPTELNIIGGIKPVVGPVTFDLGFVYYFYPWGDHPDDLDIIELKAGLEFSPVTNLTLKPVYWYVPDQDNAAETSTIEGTAAYELPAVGIFSPTISGTVGWTEALGEYTYWNAGLALGVEKFTFDFRYWDTDLDDGTGLTDERFVFTASITLP